MNVTRTQENVVLHNATCEGKFTSDPYIKVAEAIRTEIQNLKMPHAQSEVSHYVTLSLGVTSMLPSPELSSEELIARADEALYAAKKQGRNRACTI